MLIINIFTSIPFLWFTFQLGRFPRAAVLVSAAFRGSAVRGFCLWFVAANLLVRHGPDVEQNGGEQGVGDLKHGGRGSTWR